MKVSIRRQHSIAFKRAAVKQSIQSPDTLVSIGKQLGISPALLSKWRNELTKPTQSSEPSIENDGPEKSYRALEEENRRLKKALERAELEAEILKKAKEYFDKNLK